MNVGRKDISNSALLDWKIRMMNYFDSATPGLSGTEVSNGKTEPGNSYSFMLSSQYDTQGPAALGWPADALAAPLVPQEPTIIPSIDIPNLGFPLYSSLDHEVFSPETDVDSLPSPEQESPLFGDGNPIQSVGPSVLLNISAAKAIKPYSTGVTPWVTDPNWVNQQLPDVYDIMDGSSMLSRPLTPFSDQSVAKSTAAISVDTSRPSTPPTNDVQFNVSIDPPSPVKSEKKTTSTFDTAMFTVINKIASRPQLLAFSRAKKASSKCGEDRCNVLYSTLLQELAHAISKHKALGANKFHCIDDNCPMATIGFSSAKELQNHMAKKHHSFSHTCRLCPLFFSRHDGLLRHIRSRHADRVEELQDAEDKIDVAFGNFERNLERELKDKLGKVRKSTTNELQDIGENPKKCHQITSRHLREERLIKVEYEINLGVKNIQINPSLRRYYQEHVEAKLFPTQGGDDSSRPFRRRLGSNNRKRCHPEDLSASRKTTTEFDLVKSFESSLSDKRFLLPLTL